MSQFSPTVPHHAIIRLFMILFGFHELFFSLASSNHPSLIHCKFVLLLSKYSISIEHVDMRLKIVGAAASACSYEKFEFIIT